MGQGVLDQQSGDQVYFPQTTSADNIERAMSDFKNGAISTENPDWYTQYIKRPLESMGASITDPIMTVRSAIGGIREALQPIVPFNISPTPAEKEAFKNVSPMANTVGALGGQIPPFLALEAATGGVGGVISKIPWVANAAKGLMAARDAGVVSSEGIKVASAGAKFGTVMGEYGALSSASEQKQTYGNVDWHEVSQDAAKQAGFGLVAGGTLAYIAKPLAELKTTQDLVAQTSKAMLASGSIMATQAAVSGASPRDIVLNFGMGLIMAGTHIHGELQSFRQSSIEEYNDLIHRYLLSQASADPTVVEQIAHENTTNHAVNAINKSLNDAIKRNSTVEIRSEPTLTRSGNFNDPYDPKMMDFLSQYIPINRIVRMNGIDRVALANSSIKDLEGYRENYKEMNQEILNEKTTKSPIEEVSTSQELTNNFFDNVSKEIFVKSPSVEKPVSQTEQIPEFTGNKQTDEYATKIAGNPEAIKAVEDHVSSMKDNLSTLQKEDAVDTTINPAREKEMARLSNQISLSNDVIKSVNKPELVPIESTSETKTSGLSQSVEKSAVKKGLVEDLGDLPSYKTRNMDQIAGKVSDFITNNYELAKKIALGEAPEQDGLRQPELYTGIRVKAEAEGDISTLRDLALSEKASALATEAGQRVQALNSNAENSPIEAIKEVKKSREEAIKEKVSPKERKSMVKDIQKEIKKVRPKIEDWNSFIDSLEC